MKKSVILADNSYTIRRIVELSFSEEEDIDLISLDTGLNIKEKILEIKPSVILADIKLPETNGYEICRFINNNEKLKAAKVFLIKGGFEPVDEAQLKDLTYVDFITKPFDSKALVSRIKDLLSTDQAELQPTQETEIPSSIPEDIPSIDGVEDVGEDISFSDIGENIDTEKFFGDNETQSREPISDEVQPSEEITQGAGNEESDDKLSPDFSDELENPFEGDNSISVDSSDLSTEEREIRANIKKQEEELNIGSLTMEEINIENEIKKRENSELQQKDNNTEEVSKSIVENISAPSSIEDIDDSQLENVFSPKQEQPIIEEPPKPQREETKKTIPDISETTIDTPETIHHTDRKEEIEKVLSEIKVSEEKVSTEPPLVVNKPPAVNNVTETPVNETPLKTPDIPDKDIVMKNVEDKLSQSVKEILWEIVPPLAEKLIKEEINKIENQIDKELSQKKPE